MLITAHSEHKQQDSTTKMYQPIMRMMMDINKTAVTIK